MTTDDKPGQGKTWDALNTRGLAAKRETVRELELSADDPAIAQLAECSPAPDIHARRRDRPGRARAGRGGRGRRRARILGRVGQSPGPRCGWAVST